MSTTAINWKRWFPAAVPAGSGWRLIRFESVDAEGKPVGKPIEAVTPTLNPRRFPSEQRAIYAARELNAVDGL
ncbi:MULTISPECIES: hypothetical protein [Xanthomonas]|uniref:hypothetical protein n=1 Tax=Xanthomonas TaxID=338 RepID=UPI000E1F3FC7|nr:MULTISPECIES: hypothetical protein [Xanthomonas]